MKTAEMIHSVNLNAGTGFPYLVLEVTGRSSSPVTPGFRTMHWHEDLQFIYVWRGCIRVKTLSARISVRQQEALFLNRNVAHLIEADENCRYHSFLFPDSLLRFYPGSPAETLVSRIAGREALPFCTFTQQTPWHREVLNALRRLAGLEAEKNELYPYRVLCLLCTMWLELQENLSLPPFDRTGSTVSTRMRCFLEYMHSHYAERLSLAEIAGSANVSVSELLRCFRSCMQTTPYRYLTELRLNKAAAMLRETDEPIVNIAADTGFSQPSHFGKCFQEKTGLSPREYRKRNSR